MNSYDKITDDFKASIEKIFERTKQDLIKQQKQEVDLINCILLKYFLITMIILLLFDIILYYIWTL